MESNQILDEIRDINLGYLLLSRPKRHFCRFRFDDRLIAEMLSNDSRDQAVTKSHAAILLAGKPAEAVV